MDITTTKYYLYIRKSTDEEDRQVLSLEAQMHELKEFAVREHIEIVGVLEEKKTAKVPGREVFNNMLDKIEHGLPHQIGILSWAPDRLSRNSVDAGRMIYLLDTNKLHDLRFPTFAFQNSPSGKFFLSIALSNAKYYVDSLSENVKRGNRAKLRRGEWPGQKPFGYIYDHRLRNIVPEPKQAKIVECVFQDYATGKYTLKSISVRLAELAKTKEKSNYAIEVFLRNELYIGVMHWNDEAYEGKYKPLIRKQLFAKVAEVLNSRRKPRKSKHRHDFPFTGLFRCSCDSMITAQWAKGNGGVYRYYRCTRKQGGCVEKYIQENRLRQLIVEQAQTIALPADWAEALNTKLDAEEKQEAQSAGMSAEAVSRQMILLDEKLDKLLEGYLDGLIDEESYKRKKELFIEQKMALKQERETLLRTRMSGWIEPTREWIKTLVQADKIASETNLHEISNFVQKIGTNRRLAAQTPTWDWVPEFAFAEGVLARFVTQSAAASTAASPDFSGSPFLCVYCTVLEPGSKIRDVGPTTSRGD